MSEGQWLEKNKEREITPEQLAEIIKPGSRIYLGTGCSEPVLLTEPNRRQAHASERAVSSVKVA